MAVFTTLQVIAVDGNNNDVQKSIGYANPNASNYVLKTTAQKLNSLTTNTFKKAIRVDKEDITDATNE